MMRSFHRFSFISGALLIGTLACIPDPDDVFETLVTSVTQTGDG